MTKSCMEFKFVKAKDEALVLHPKLQGSYPHLKKKNGEKFSNFSGLVPMFSEVPSTCKILKHHAS